MDVSFFSTPSLNTHLLPVKLQIQEPSRTVAVSLLTLTWLTSLRFEVCCLFHTVNPTERVSAQSQNAPSPCYLGVFLYIHGVVCCHFVAKRMYKKTLLLYDDKQFSEDIVLP